MEATERYNEVTDSDVELYRAVMISGWEDELLQRPPQNWVRQTVSLQCGMENPQKINYALRSDLRVPSQHLPLHSLG